MHLQEALTRLHEDQADDGDTRSGFYVNTSDHTGRQFFVLVRPVPARAQRRDGSSTCLALWGKTKCACMITLPPCISAQSSGCAVAVAPGRLICSSKANAVAGAGMPCRA